MYKSLRDNYSTISVCLTESIHQKTVMGAIKLQAWSQYATDFYSVDQLLKTPSIEKKASEHILKALYMT